MSFLLHYCHSFCITVIPSGLLSFLPYYCHSFRILSFLPYYCHSFRIIVISNICHPEQLLYSPIPEGWPYLRVLLKKGMTMDQKFILYMNHLKRNYLVHLQALLILRTSIHYPFLLCMYIHYRQKSGVICFILQLYVIKLTVIVKNSWYPMQAVRGLKTITTQSDCMYLATA